MSTVPVARQLRRPVRLADGSVRWEVTTTIVDAGDLPFVELFVATIVDPADPKRDVLARVATPQELRRADPSAPLYVKVAAADLVYLGGDPFARIASVDDLTALPRDRVVAVRDGRGEFLVAAVTVLYDGLSTAAAAYHAFLDRLSALVAEWRAASGALITSPYQDYPLPQDASGAEAQLAAAFAAAKGKRVAAEAARDAARDAKEACERDCAADTLVYDVLVADVAYLERARQVVLGLTEGFAAPPALVLLGGTALTAPGTYTIAGAPSTRAKDFALGQSAFAGSADTYEALLARKRTARDLYAGKVRDCATRCALLGTALALAQNAVDGTRAVETGALAAVVVVCPTFNPETGALS